MFPTLSSLIKYLTGITIHLPVQTFGLFVALAFWLSYIAFKKEFYRKEKAGLIHPFDKRKLQTGVVYWAGLIALGMVISWLGYKLAYGIQHYRAFTTNPASFLLSTKGSYTGGFLACVAFTAWQINQHKKSTGNAVENDALIHPYELTDRMLLWCASTGFIGAVLFAKLDYIYELFSDPFNYLSSFNGLTFLGGFIFGAAIYLYRTKKMGIPFLIAADIGSPGMILAYGVGRMGCHLSGDGDWGIVNTSIKPAWLGWAPDWLWSFDFPHNVIHEGSYIQGCADQYCNVLTQPVYPTSFYESVICMVLFFGLWFSRRLIKTNGVMFFSFIFLFGLQRFLMEFIKLNPKYSLISLCLSQAQYISLAFMLMGVGGLIYWGRYRK